MFPTDASMVIEKK